MDVSRAALEGLHATSVPHTSTGQRRGKAKDKREDIPANVLSRKCQSGWSAAPILVQTPCVRLGYGRERYARSPNQTRRRGTRYNIRDQSKRHGIEPDAMSVPDMA
eukprot:2010036-Rhodomonas_salina.1